MSSPETRPLRPDSRLGSLLRFGRSWGFLLFLLAVVVVFREVILPFLLATAVAYLLSPVVGRLEPRLGRGLSIAVCYLGIIGLLMGIVAFLIPALVQDIARLRDAIPHLIEYVDQRWLSEGNAWIQEIFGDVLAEAETGGAGPNHELVLGTNADGQTVLSLDHLRLHVHEAPGGGWLVEAPQKLEEADGVDEFLRGLVANSGADVTLMIGNAVGAAVTKIASFLTQFVLTFMLAGFLLIDLDAVLRFVRWLVPPVSHADFDEILRGVDKGMAGVIRGQLIICLVNGILTYIGLLLIDVKYSLLLGIIAAVFSLIPIFGTIISSIPIIVVAMVSTESGDIEIGKGVAVLAWICGIHLVEANYLNPKIIGSSAQIHPVIVVFALLAGESMAGLTGALLAVPVASMIQTIFLFARRHASEFPVELPEDEPDSEPPKDQE